jgi:uncharacterized NAD-dependent epimerase/dehydratase family protein
VDQNSKAVLLTDDNFSSSSAKTSHAMVRGPSRFAVMGVVDATCAGSDAGFLLDSKPRGIPIYPSIQSMLKTQQPDYCVVGVATKGGVIPPSLRIQILDAIKAGVSIVNGLHQLLASDDEFTACAEKSGAELIDIRKPRPVSELQFWSGKIFDLSVPKIAVLGTDCAIGKRTTSVLLRDSLVAHGLRAEVVYTGQTGWLQGFKHGFILDATPNDFVSGELERAIISCAEEEDPEVILIEGQSSLFNPSGPCGLELVISGAVQGVILQHAPAREFYKGMEDLPDCRVVPISRDIELLHSLGKDVWGLTLSEIDLDEHQAKVEKSKLEATTGIKTYRPLSEEIDSLALAVKDRLSKGGKV